MGKSGGGGGGKILTLADKLGRGVVDPTIFDRHNEEMFVFVNGMTLS